MRQEDSRSIPSTQGSAFGDVLAGRLSNQSLHREMSVSAGRSAPAAQSAERKITNKVPATGPTGFKDFYALGYTRLVPIIPPDAEISENSSLLKRKDARGKAVGVRGFGGKWFGFDWLPHESDTADIERWQEMGAGIGIKTGRDLVCIDADTLDEAAAKIIRDTVEKHCGRLPARVGRYPKVAYPVRVTEPVQYCRVEFGERDERGSLTSRVEILSEGRQFVVHGIHPGTKQPYEWPRNLTPKDALPAITPAQLAAMMTELESLLPAARPIVTEGSTAAVNQAALTGDLALVTRAVEAIPNSSKNFSTRESYRDFGYAIKAALPDNPDEAFQLFAAWCDRWEDGTNDPDIVEADWRRMKPPYRRGAGWLYELAEARAPDKFSRAEQWFQPITTQESVFGEQSDRAPAPVLLKPTVYEFPDPAMIPPRPWLYGDHYIRGRVTATVAPGGLGKSSLAIVEALAMTTGKPLLGIRPKGLFKVWLWNGEEPSDELARRIAAAMQHYGLTGSDVGGRLCVDNGFQQPIAIAKTLRSETSVYTPMFDAAVAAIREQGIELFILDPFVSTHQVSENDNGAIDAVVKAWGRIANKTGAGIELVHHSRKTNGAEVNAEAARGGSAFVDGARSVRALTRMSNEQAKKMGITEPRRYFRFSDEGKTNMAPSAGLAGEVSWFTTVSVSLPNVRLTGAGDFTAADSVGVVVKANPLAAVVPVDADKERSALTLIESAEWRSRAQAGDAWVGYAVARVFGLSASDPDDRQVINGHLARWYHGRVIEDVTARDPKSRKDRQIVRVVRSPASASLPQNQGVFG